MKHGTVVAVLAVLAFVASAPLWAASVNPNMGPGGEEPALPPIAIPRVQPVEAAPVPRAPAPAKVEAAPVARPAAGIEDLKALYKEADIIIQFSVDSIQARTDVSPALPWEVKAAIMEVIRGKILPGQILIHIEAPTRALGMPRTEAVGKEFVAAIKPMSGTERRYQLMGPGAFPADSQEAEALRQLAKVDLTRGAGGQALELTVRPLVKAFPVIGPKTLEVRLTNTGTDSATYRQAPMTEQDGKLYLPGPGMLRIRDTLGRIVPDKGNILQGQVPPQTVPALILSRASLVETLDLSKYFDLPEARYTLVLALTTPDGRSRIGSNGFSFQVGASSAAGREPTPPEPIRAVEPVPDAAAQIEMPAPAPAAKPAGPAIPDPAAYRPGKVTLGLAGLLRPRKAQFAAGDPVEVELRLINDGPRTLTIDTRLERTLTVKVVPVAGSPDPRTERQLINWPPSPPMPEERAYLREGAFWGQTINLNVLPLRPQEEFQWPTAEEAAAGKNLTYERFGKILFGFPRPGVYNISATYTVARPKGPEGQPGPDSPMKDWWFGDLQTNTITIQIVEGGR